MEEDKGVVKKQKRAEYVKRWRTERNANKKESGRDSTRVSRLNRDELMFLASKLPDVVVEKNGFPSVIDESFWCHLLPAQKGKLYPNSVTLQNYFGIRSSNSFRFDQLFCPSHIVLALDGRFATSPNDDASHLCGNHCCIRASHLVWESRSVNTKRNYCIGTTQCTCCGVRKEHCACNPKCIKLKFV